MKKIINAIVLILTGLCIVTSIKLSSLPLWPVFSDDSFWYTSATDREAFSLIYDICVGFLLSAIFYLLVEMVPEITRLHRGKALICNYVNALMEQMEKLISICLQVYKIENHSTLYLKNLGALNGNISYADEDISFLITTYYNSGKRKTGVHSAGKFDSVIKSCIAEIEKQLQNINRFGYFYASNDKFLEIITRIESCKFLSQYKNNQKCFLYADTDNSFYDFYLLYREMQKIKFHTEYTCTVVDSAEVCAAYKEKRESGELISKVLVYQQKRADAYSQEQPILVYSNNPDQHNIITRIKTSIPHLLVCNEDTLDSSCIQKSQLIILLSNKTLINNLEFFSPHQKIFQFSSRILPEKVLLLPRKRDNLKRIYYKKPLSILGVPFNAEHPTENDIGRLTSEIDDYIKEKYSLELDIP